MAIYQLCSTQLQKEVKCNPKTAQLQKSMQKAIVKKDVKSKVVAKK